MTKLDKILKVVLYNDWASSVSLCLGIVGFGILSHLGELLIIQLIPIVLSWVHLELSARYYIPYYNRKFKEEIK